MITIKTMKQIPNSGMIKGFRSGGSRLKSPQVEQGRMMVAYFQMLHHEDRRQWLREQWLGQEGRHL